MCNKIENKVTKKIGRPAGKGMTPEEKKIYLRDRSRIYYTKEENKIAQRERMRLERVKRAPILNERTGKLRRLRTIENRLKKFWTRRGLIKVQ